MVDWTTALLAALGYLLGHLFTRAMRLSDEFPARYATKDDCKGFRMECSRDSEQEKAELIRRMERIEAKLDRLVENLLMTGGV